MAKEGITVSIGDEPADDPELNGGSVHPEEKKEAVPDFDIDQALNTSGFAEFLAEHQDYKTFDLADGRELARRFEAFTKQKEVTRTYREVVRTEIFSQIGIKLADEELDDIDKQIAREATQTPERIKERDELLKKFREEQEKIKALNGRFEAVKGKISGLAGPENLDPIRQQLSALGQERVALGEKQKILEENLKLAEQPKKSFLWFIRWSSGEQKVAAELLDSDEYRDLDPEKIKADLAALDKKIVEAGEAFLTAEELNACQKELSKLQNNLLGDAEALRNIHQTAADKAKEKLFGLFNPSYNKLYEPGDLTFKRLKEAQDYFNNLLKLKEEDDGRQNYVPEMTNQERKTYQTNLNNAIEGVVVDDIENIIKKASLGSSALDRLTQALSRQYLILESMGSRDAQETRDYVRGTLEGLADELVESKTKDDVARSFLIRRVLINTQPKT